MNQYHPTRGFAVLPVLIVVAVVGIAVAYFSSQRDSAMEKKETPSPSVMEKKDDVMMEKTGSPTPTAMMKKEEGAMAAKATVQEYTKAAYDTAVASGKPVVLYYYANWCPICKAQYPLFQSAAASFDSSSAAFFRVSFNDTDTTADETASAKEHQVGSQHTVVVVRNGAQVYKSQETGNYASRLTELLK
jgi:thiol-disulfide isomerase/thioredoxin